MDKFERSVLIGGADPTYSYTKGIGIILVNSRRVEIQNVIVSSPDELQHLAAVLSAAYLDHQKLARGATKLAHPLKHEEEKRLRVVASSISFGGQGSTEEDSPQSQAPSDDLQDPVVS